jgi:hypothetical protein
MRLLKEYEEDVNALLQGRTVQVVDTSHPNAARIYDYLLGGKDNFAPDRTAAGELLRLIPDVAIASQRNRRFMRRAVSFLAAEAGIRQFIDIGAGLPTQGNVHEVAQRFDPDARVLYADYDPVVVAHARARLAGAADRVAAIQGDLRRPEDILGDPDLRKIINLGEPVAILLIAVLHFIADDEGPYECVDALKAAMPTGSYLVLTHITDDEISEEVSLRAQAVYRAATARPWPRSRLAVERFFDGLRLVEPGVVDTSEWRPEWPLPHPGRTLIYAGVARKP